MNPLIQEGGILHPRKKKEIPMIGYATHVPNSGGGGCWDPFPPLKKDIKRISPNEEKKEDERKRESACFLLLSKLIPAFNYSRQ